MPLSCNFSRVIHLSLVQDLQFYSLDYLSTFPGVRLLAKPFFPMSSTSFPLLWSYLLWSYRMAYAWAPSQPLFEFSLSLSQLTPALLFRLTTHTILDWPWNKIEEKKRIDIISAVQPGGSTGQCSPLATSRAWTSVHFKDVGRGSRGWKGQAAGVKKRQKKRMMKRLRMSLGDWPWNSLTGVE